MRSLAFELPRLTSSQRNQLFPVELGTTIYNISNNAGEVYTNEGWLSFPPVSTSLSILGSPSNSTVKASNISFTGDHHVIKRSGNTLISGLIENDNIASGSILPIKLSPGANDTILTTNSSGNVTWINKLSAFNKDFGILPDTITEGGTTVLKTGDIVTGVISNTAISGEIINKSITDVSFKIGDVTSNTNLHELLTYNNAVTDISYSIEDALISGNRVITHRVGTSGVPGNSLFYFKASDGHYSFFKNGYLALNGETEVLNINTGLTLGQAIGNSDGIIDFNGTNFRGYKNGNWFNLDDPGLTVEEIQDLVANLMQDTTSVIWSYDDNNDFLSANVSLVPFTTTDLAEGINLYYTEPRFTASLLASSTTGLPEGDNLYYTDERVDDRVSNLIIAGDGLSKVYDDNANTLTLSADTFVLNYFTHRGSRLEIRPDSATPNSGYDYNNAVDLTENVFTSQLMAGSQYILTMQVRWMAGTDQGLGVLPTGLTQTEAEALYKFPKIAFGLKQFASNDGTGASTELLPSFTGEYLTAKGYDSFDVVKSFQIDRVITPVIDGDYSWRASTYTLRTENELPGYLILAVWFKLELIVS